jgi:hypothetical protein
MDSTPNPLPTTPAPKASEITWESVKPWVTGTLTLLLAAAVIAAAIVWLGESTENHIRKEYAQLTDEASRTNFAKRYPTHPLGGLVLLGQANGYYAQGNYAAANAAFAKASLALKNEPVLGEQAKLGEVFSQYYLDPAKGLPLLKEMAANTALMESTRGYAAYELLSKALFDKDWDGARNYATLLKALKTTGIWQRQVATLSEIYPQLKAQ